MTIALTVERTEFKAGHALLALLVLASWIATAFAENRQTQPPRSTGQPPGPWIGAIPRGPPARFF
jgi:hypothetical protein